MDDDKRIRQDLDNKLRLEASMENRLGRVFKSIRDDLQGQIKVRRTGFDTFRWEYAFYRAFLDHYYDVGKTFSNNMERQLNLAVTEDERNLIENSLALFYSSLALSSAQEAASTTLKHANDAMVVATSQERESLSMGEVFTLATFASVVDKQMAGKLKGRTHAIKVSETQKSAEAAKLTEAQVLDAGLTNINTPNTFISSTNLKDWHGILDDKIRDTHLEADSTQRNIPMNEFFIVGGFRMMYPADSSHGAPKREIINCRCSALYKMRSDKLDARKK